MLALNDWNLLLLKIGKVLNPTHPLISLYYIINLMLMSMSKALKFSEIQILVSTPNTICTFPNERNS